MQSSEKWPLHGDQLRFLKGDSSVRSSRQMILDGKDQGGPQQQQRCLKLERVADGIGFLSCHLTGERKPGFIHFSEKRNISALSTCSSIINFNQPGCNIPKILILIYQTNIILGDDTIIGPNLITVVSILKMSLYFERHFLKFPFGSGSLLCTLELHPIHKTFASTICKATQHLAQSDGN